jgi:hypothetical protein
MHTANSDWLPPEERYAGRARAALERSRDWLDARGRAAWIAATVAGFHPVLAPGPRHFSST